MKLMKEDLTRWVPDSLKSETMRRAEEILSNDDDYGNADLARDYLFAVKTIKFISGYHGQKQSIDEIKQQLSDCTERERLVDALVRCQVAAREFFGVRFDYGVPGGPVIEDNA